MKVQNTSASSNSARPVVYLTARDIQDRFDEVFGLGGWKVSFTMHPNTQRSGWWFAPTTISVRIGDEWIDKSDIGTGEDPKDAVSDGLKRAAVMFGPGRFLYDCELGWFDCVYTSKGKFKKWKNPNEVKAKLEKVLKANGTYVPPSGRGGESSESESTPVKKADPFAQVKTLAKTLGIGREDIDEVALKLMGLESFSKADDTQRKQMVFLLKAHPKSLTNDAGESFEPNFAMAGDGQVGLLRGLCQDVFGDDKEKRNAALKKHTGRPTDSPSKLLNSEAITLIDLLKDQIDQQKS